MRGNIKSWLWVFAPFVLLLAFFLNLAMPKKYSAAEVMSPDFMRDFIQAEYTRAGQSINPDTLDIMDIQKIDDRVLVAYAPYSGVDARDYNLAVFREYYGGYTFVSRNYYLSQVDIPDLACAHIMTNYGSGSKEPDGFYLAFLSQAENLRQIKLYYKKDYWRDDRPDESWQLLEELAVDKCPALLIMPEVQPPEGSKCGSYLTYYAFLDENGEEIAFFRIEHSYDTYVG